MRGISTCLAHDHPEPTPLVAFPLHPRARTNPKDAPPRTVAVCPNTAAAAYDLLDELERHALTNPHPSADDVIRSLPAHTWRRYDGPARLLAYKTWRAYGPRFLSGRYREQHQIWWADGSPKIPDLPSVRDLRTLAAWPRALRRRLSHL